MGDNAAAYDRLIERFVSWANARDDIRAAIIIGSRARTDTPADEWSDLDVIFFTTDPHRYVADTGWLDCIGPHQLTFVEPTFGGNAKERRVVFDEALDVDFVPLPVEMLRSCREHGIPPEMQAVLRRGVRVVLDKDGVCDVLTCTPLPPEVSEPPTREEFLNVVNDFWYHCVWTVKKLRRGEVRTAHGCLSGYLFWRCLLPMIVWDAKARNGWQYDTWHDGRFIERWADAWVIAALSEASPRYDERDIRRALPAAMDLFRRLANETAVRLNYPYPTSADESVTKWVRACLTDRRGGHQGLPQ